MNDAINHLHRVIEQINSDIAMHERLAAAAETDAGRAYQTQQAEDCRRRLAKRQAMLAAEVAKTN